VEARQGAPGALRLVELACRAFIRQIPPVKVNPRFQVLDVDRIAGGGFRPLSRTKAASLLQVNTAKISKQGGTTEQTLRP